MKITKGITICATIESCRGVQCFQRSTNSWCKKFPPNDYFRNFMPSESPSRENSLENLRPLSIESLPQLLSARIILNFENCAPVPLPRGTICPRKHCPISKKGIFLRLKLFSRTELTRRGTIPWRSRLKEEGFLEN